MKRRISKDYIHYSFGATFSGNSSWWGIALISCAILFSTDEEYILAIALFIIGINLFIAIKGVEINIKEKKVKSYFLFLFFKTGEWTDLNNYDTLVLQRFSDISTISYRSHSSTTSIRSYELYLIGKANNKILLTEFKKYTEAKDNLIQCGKLLDLRVLDKVK